MKLSVIVPAYNEEKVIGETLKVLEGCLLRSFPDHEIVVVSDGSQDGTFAAAKRFASERVRVFEYRPNSGKGQALKYGFSKTTGRLVVFYDTGLDFPVSQIGQFLQKLEEEKAAVVIGSKRHPHSQVDYPFKRRIVSFLAQLCVRLLFGLNVSDTQVGLKVFRREVLEKVMPLILVRRYAFDIELLALSQHYGFKIVEAPVTLQLKFSTAASLNSIWKCFVDALAVFYRLRVLKFYDLPEAERQRMVREYQTTPWDRMVSVVSRVLGKDLGNEAS